MLSLLLLFVFTSIFLYRLGSGAANQRDARPWQGEFLIAAAIWGALLVGITEGLSLFYAINQLWLAISWSIVLAGVLAMGWRSGRIVLGWQRIVEGFQLMSKFEIGLLTALAAIAGLLYEYPIYTPFKQSLAVSAHIFQ